MTQPTDVSVDEFIAAVPDERKRADSQRLIALMKKITRKPPVLWGPSIIGFGSFHYRYESGREGDAPLIGFSPRKTSLVLYVFAEPEVTDELLSRLGPHKRGAACLYVKRLSDVDEGVLVELMRAGATHAEAQDVRS